MERHGRGDTVHGEGDVLPLIRTASAAPLADDCPFIRQLRRHISVDGTTISSLHPPVLLAHPTNQNNED